MKTHFATVASESYKSPEIKGISETNKVKDIADARKELRELSKKLPNLLNFSSKYQGMLSDNNINSMSDQNLNVKTQPNST